MKKLVIKILSLLSEEELIQIIDKVRGDVNLSDSLNDLLHEIYNTWEKQK